MRVDLSPAGRGEKVNLLLTIIVDGLIEASWLFIVALGLTLVFGVLKILNIAHGSFYALGAYIAATVVTMAAAKGLPPAASFVAMLLAAAFVASAVGLMLERGLLKMFYGRDEVVLLLVTYAVFLLLEDLTKLIWGVNPIYATQPYDLFGNVSFGKLFYVGYDLVLIPIADPERRGGVVRVEPHGDRQDRLGRHPQRGDERQHGRQGEARLRLRLCVRRAAGGIRGRAHRAEDFGAAGP